MVRSRWEVFCGACSLSALGDVGGCREGELGGLVECLDDLEASGRATEWMANGFHHMPAPKNR